jgi:hypothetical protein
MGGKKLPVTKYDNFWLPKHNDGRQKCAQNNYMLIYICQLLDFVSLTTANLWSLCADAGSNILTFIQY